MNADQLVAALHKVVELPVVVVGFLVLTIVCMGAIIFVALGGLRSGHGDR